MGLRAVRVGSRQQLKGTIREHRETPGINAHKEFLGYEWLPDFHSARLPDGPHFDKRDRQGWAGLVVQKVRAEGLNVGRTRNSS